MKTRKIGTRLLALLLTVSLAAMLLLTVISYNSSASIIQDQIQKNMNSELNAQINNILLKTDKISTIATQIARTVASTYKTTSLKQYEEMLGKAIYDSDLASGSGIWFEPYVYNGNEKYVGPYVYKDGNKPTVTYDYSNATYDYFKYDWYTNAKNKDKKSIFSALYYDDTLKTTMATCTAPIYDANNTFLGAITVDMDISTIQKMIDGLTIGDKGKITLLREDGIYITNSKASKVMKDNMKDEKNTSLSELAKKMLTSDSGSGDFVKDKISYKAYYCKVGDLGWRMFVQVPKSEMDKPLNSLLIKLIRVIIIALLLLCAAIILQVKYLTKNIKKINHFALQLADGDFATQELVIRSKDELGQVGESLNKMLQENKSVIQTISSESQNIRNASMDLEETTKNLKASFHTIDGAIKNINEGVMSSSAATEEVNASVEEVNASINILTQETGKSNEMALSIKNRASDVKNMSNESFEKAMQLSTEKEKNLNKSMEEAKIVESIGVLAETISQIAEQVNLLSLNASIEAARAGEQGKGFAVVAKEIGSLAAKTSTTVNEITQTTDKVRIAFDNLMDNSTQLLSFIQNVVTPDYQTFVQVGNQYEKDANDIQMTATNISDMTNNIERIINEVVQAIQGIAIESENTSSNSSDIINSMDHALDVVNNIVLAVNDQKEMSDNLDQMVNQFKLD